METLWQDMRYGLRMLWKKPGMTFVAVLTLALGIGANTAIFSIVDAFLLRPLPYPDADRLMVLFDTQPDLETAPASYLEFKDWREQLQVFDQMSGLFHMSFNFVGQQEPERIRGAYVTEGYFALLGARAATGRTFSAAEHQMGADPVAVVGYGFWQRQMGGDPSLVGKSIVLNNQSYTVIGIMPPDAPSFSSQNRTEVWLPMEPNTPWRDRGTHFMTVMARLKPGIDPLRAQAEIDTVAKRLAAANPDQSTHGIRFLSLRTHLVGDTRTRLLVMFAAVAVVLLIALANVANLLLARATGRAKEFAVRTALGAGRWRLLRQLLTESILLAVVSGALGTLLAVWATDLIVSGWPSGIPKPEHIGVDWRVLGFTALLSLTGGIAFGLAPALRAVKVNLNESLKENATQTVVARSQRTRHLLVISEIALATMLLLAAGLLLKSFYRLQHVDPGFQPDNVLTMQISLPSARYREPHQRSAFFQNVLQRVSVLPGVEAVGMVNNLPLGGGSMNGDFTIEGRPPFPADQQPLSEKYIASADYFRAMGIPLRRGRFFTEQDAKGQPEVIIINETFARRHFPNEDPLGKRMSWDGVEMRTIVGVVGDVKHTALDRTTELESYVPSLQSPSSGMTVVIRTSQEPTALAAAVRKEVYAVDKEQPVSNVRALSQIVSNSIAEQRLSAALLGSFALLALVLASVGIYGVMSYAVTQRTHEIGVRMALGAQAGDVLKMVLGHGMFLTLSGVVLGLVAAFALTRLMASLLFNVHALDLLTFVSVPLLLSAVALVSCYIPARRATRVDPMTALRYE